MKSVPDIIPILDINLAAFLVLNGIHPKLTKQGSRVIFEFPGTSETYKIMEQYNRNPAVPVLDFVSALRRTRSQMLSLRG
jgi:hypothetical protein